MHKSNYLYVVRRSVGAFRAINEYPLHLFAESISGCLTDTKLLNLFVWSYTNRHYQQNTPRGPVSSLYSTNFQKRVRTWCCHASALPRFRASVPAFFGHGFAGPFSLGSGPWITTGPSTKITHSLYFIASIANTYWECEQQLDDSRGAPAPTGARTDVTYTHDNILIENDEERWRRCPKRARW